MLIRILKFLTIFILILIIAFFSLGILSPNVEYQSQTTVSGSVEDVFQSYNDIESIGNWIPEIKEVKVLKETQKKEGSVYEMLIDSDGTDVKMKETVLKYSENKLVALRFDTGPMKKNDEFQFEEENGATKITGTHSVEGTNYFYKCMFTMFKGGMSKIDQKYMDNFKEYHENRK